MAGKRKFRKASASKSLPKCDYCNKPSTGGQSQPGKGAIYYCDEHGPSNNKPIIPPGGDVKTNYNSISRDPVTVVAPAVAGFGIPSPTRPVLAKIDMTPTGKLELRKEYKLKDGLYAIVETRKKATLTQVQKVTWKKGITQADHSIKWSPSIEAVEKFVEDFIFANLEET